MSSPKTGWFRTFALAVTIVVAGTAFRARVGGPLVVRASTMTPTLNAGEWVWAWKTSAEAQPGDVVWVQWPGSRQSGVYRVIASGPAVVSVDARGQATVDDEVERWTGPETERVSVIGGVSSPVLPGGPSMESVMVPMGSVFVLSDARAVGGDSRVHGPIPHSAILATVAEFSLR